MSLAALAVARCSLATSTDGLSGGAARTTRDGGDGSSLDASGGASAAVDSAGPRGGVDGAPSTDAASASDGAPQASYCSSLAPAPLFCDDFDQRDLAASWDSIFRSEASVTLAGDDVFSAPRAMKLATSTPSDLALAGYAVKAFPAWTARPMTATLAFQMHVQSAGSANGVDVPMGAIQLLEASGKLYELELRVVANGSALRGTLSEHTLDGNAETRADHGFSMPVPFDAWTRIEIVLTYRPLNPSSARLLIDGLKAIDLTVDTSVVVGGTPRAALGITAVKGAIDPWIVRYDNAVFDATP